jgi:hypothetical protein
MFPIVIFPFYSPLANKPLYVTLSGLFLLAVLNQSTKSRDVLGKEDGLHTGIVLRFKCAEVGVSRTDHSRYSCLWHRLDVDLLS